MKFSQWLRLWHRHSQLSLRDNVSGIAICSWLGENFHRLKCRNYFLKTLSLVQQVQQQSYIIVWGGNDDIAVIPTYVLERTAHLSGWEQSNRRFANLAEITRKRILWLNTYHTGINKGVQQFYVLSQAAHHHRSRTAVINPHVPGILHAVFSLLAQKHFRSTYISNSYSMNFIQMLPPGNILIPDL